MYLHLSNETLNRKPWIGATIGGLGLAMALFFAWYFTGQLRRYGQVPKELDATTAIFSSPDSDDGDWVRLTGTLKVFCASKVEELNPWDQSLIFGRVSRTFFLATTLKGERVYILQISGPADCEKAKSSALVGVLSAPRNEILATYSSWTSLFQKASPQMFCLTCGPKEIHNYLWAILAFGVLSSWLLLRFLRKLKEQREKEHRKQYLGMSAGQS